MKKRKNQKDLKNQRTQKKIKTPVSQANTIHKPKETKRFLKPLLLILGITLATYLIMLWISPESENLPEFLAGFGFSFAIIVFLAYYLNYISGLYKQIRNSKSK